VNFGTSRLGISYHILALFFFLFFPYIFCSRPFTLVSLPEKGVRQLCLRKKKLVTTVTTLCWFYAFSGHPASLIVLYCFHLSSVSLLCVRLGGGLAGATLQVLLLAAGWCGWVLSVFFCWNHTDHGACGVLFSFALGTGTGREGDEAGGRGIVCLYLADPCLYRIFCFLSYCLSYLCIPPYIPTLYVLSVLLFPRGLCVVSFTPPPKSCSPYRLCLFSRLRWTVSR